MLELAMESLSKWDQVSKQYYKALFSFFFSKTKTSFPKLEFIVIKKETKTIKSKTQGKKYPGQ